MKKRILSIGFVVAMFVGTGFAFTPVDVDAAQANGRWIVRMVSSDHMRCDSGGQSDCPIRWFLTHEL